MPRFISRTLYFSLSGEYTGKASFTFVEEGNNTSILKSFSRNTTAKLCYTITQIFLLCILRKMNLFFQLSFYAEKQGFKNIKSELDVALNCKL